VLMLSLEVQQKLAIRYGSESLTEEYRLDFAKGLQVAFEGERKEYAVVVMLDIAGFSRLVSGWALDRIRKYLDEYYRLTIPTFYQNGGMIDRIAGDGILVIFSPFFRGTTREATDRAALQAAETVVAMVSGTDHASKAAVSCGKLLFCKTGVVPIYEEYTIIGNAITRAYRIEEVANADQIIVQASSGFRSIIDAQLSQRVVFLRGNERIRMCTVVQREHELRGVGKLNVYVQTLSPASGLQNGGSQQSR
jgi:class 3 adenylate cyclase